MRRLALPQGLSAALTIVVRLNMISAVSMAAGLDKWRIGLLSVENV